MRSSNRRRGKRRRGRRGRYSSLLRLLYGRLKDHCEEVEDRGTGEGELLYLCLGKAESELIFYIEFFYNFLASDSWTVRRVIRLSKLHSWQTHDGRYMYFPFATYPAARKIKLVRKVLLLKIKKERKKKRDKAKRKTTGASEFVLERGSSRGLALPFVPYGAWLGRAAMNTWFFSHCQTTSYAPSGGGVDEGGGGYGVGKMRLVSV